MALQWVRDSSTPSASVVLMASFHVSSIVLNSPGNLNCKVLLAHGTVALISSE